jgi:hypothetical protein
MKEERQVMEIKTRDRISYFDARKKFRELVAPTFSRSYATVVNAVQKSTIGTQTDREVIKKTTESEKQLAKPDKALKPATKTNTSGADSLPKSKPKPTGVTPARREKTPSPGPSGSPQPESMEEDEAVSESEIARLRGLAKKQRRRIRR